MIGETATNFDQISILLYYPQCVRLINDENKCKDEKGRAGACWKVEKVLFLSMLLHWGWTDEMILNLIWVGEKFVG